MAKSKALIAAETRIAELEATNAALLARLEVAKTVFRNQRTHIANIEAQLNSVGVAKTMPAAIKPQPQPRNTAPVVVVTRYVKANGAVMEKTRIGARAAERTISPATRAWIAGKWEPIYSAEMAREDNIDAMCAEYDAAKAA